jgi:hypothetical protein
MSETNEVAGETSQEEVATSFKVQETFAENNSVENHEEANKLVEDVRESSENHEEDDDQEEDEEREIPLEENNDNNLPNETQNGVATAVGTPKKRSGRGLTGYMFFLKQNRMAIKQELADEGSAFGLKEVASKVAEKWRALPEVDRKKWNDDAKLVILEPKSPENADSHKDNENSSATPVNRVREIIKADPEVKNVQGLALKLLAKATDMFATELTKLALDCGPDRKRIRLVDVHHTIHANDEKFGFLVPDFETPAQIVAREDKARKTKRDQATKAADADANAQASMDKKSSITSYFTKKEI